MENNAAERPLQPLGTVAQSVPRTADLPAIPGRSVPPNLPEVSGCGPTGLVFKWEPPRDHSEPSASGNRGAVCAEDRRPAGNSRSERKTTGASQCYVLRGSAASAHSSSPAFALRAQAGKANKSQAIPASVRQSLGISSFFRKSHQRSLCSA